MWLKLWVIIKFGPNTFETNSIFIWNIFTYSVAIDIYIYIYIYIYTMLILWNLVTLIYIFLFKSGLLKKVDMVQLAECLIECDSF